MRGWMWSEMDGYGKYEWEWMGADGQDRYACVCMDMHRSYRRMGKDRDGHAWMDMSKFMDMDERRQMRFQKRFRKKKAQRPPSKNSYGKEYTIR